MSDNVTWKKSQTFIEVLYVPETFQVQKIDFEKIGLPLGLTSDMVQGRYGQRQNLI